MASNTVSNTKLKKIVNLATSYGGIDGAHHKMWVIDQILRVALCPKDYKQWRADEEADGYEWDEGIAP